ncbi:C39 family peptidase [Skermania sp. ID1734]|uniref:C39 family peptidase n=1 Tax=Skermania sp. ID1734 TaxID=2597516 RepID=UPI00163D7914|nr:C39 family peptidase [Skermania sp. ID1734]
MHTFDTDPAEDPGTDWFDSGWFDDSVSAASGHSLLDDALGGIEELLRSITGWLHEPTPPGAHEEHAAPADGIDGNPTAWQADWFFQGRDGYCGPSSIAQVVSEYTGVHAHNPQEMVDHAVALGVFDPDHPEQGMSFQGMQRLMQDEGVPCHLEHSSMSDLEAKLDDGYGVIAMVNAGAIWGAGHDSGHGADHALVVAGIDREHGTVILSDPGNPNGNQETVPISQFEQAWQASGDTMLVADNPDPDLADSSATDTADAVYQRWAIADLTAAH